MILRMCFFSKEKLAYRKKGNLWFPIDTGERKVQKDSRKRTPAKSGRREREVEKDDRKSTPAETSGREGSLANRVREKSAGKTERGEGVTEEGTRKGEPDKGHW